MPVRSQQHLENQRQMTNNYQKEIQTKLTKGLLDMIILQFLDQQPMHGYQIITKVRKTFGVYFGPSTIYPQLNALEKKGYVKSTWNMDSERPRKVYTLTKDGETVLNFTEGSLNLICKTITTDNQKRNSSGNRAERATIPVISALYEGSVSILNMHPSGQLFLPVYIFLDSERFSSSKINSRLPFVEEKLQILFCVLRVKWQVLNRNFFLLFENVFNCLSLQWDSSRAIRFSGYIVLSSIGKAQ